jgi:hypothetical protein
MKRALVFEPRTATEADDYVPPPVRVTDRDIVEAYQYMLARWLVLRQETRDLQEGFRWNELVHRAPGGVEWANPNLDVAYSEAWIAIDQHSCTVIELPEIIGRYYTVQVLNGWAEVTCNINERNYPQHPFGKFAFVLTGSKVEVPYDAQSIQLPSKKSRVLIRIELGAAPDDVVALQKRITMHTTGSPRVEEAVVKFDFANDALPGVEGFDRTVSILVSEPDINPGMVAFREKARAVAKAATDPGQRERIDRVIRKHAIPNFFKHVQHPGLLKNGWVHPRAVGTFGQNYLDRAVVNYVGIWANSSKEAVYFGAIGLDGSQTYVQKFGADALPQSKARYFWSVGAVDGSDFRVIQNRLDRYVLNSHSGLQNDVDGSLTLMFAPELPAGVPESNWLPTPAGRKYNLTFRYYGPSSDVVDGTYYPPRLEAVT